MFFFFFFTIINHCVLFNLSLNHAGKKKKSNVAPIKSWLLIVFLRHLNNFLSKCRNKASSGTLADAVTGYSILVPAKNETKSAFKDHRRIIKTFSNCNALCQHMMC